MGPTELTTTPLHFTLKICWFYIWENVLFQFQGFPTNHVLNSATNSHLQSTFLSLLWGVCIEALNVKFMVRRLVQQPSILMFCLATHRPTFHFFISKVLETMIPAWSAPQVFPYEEFFPHSDLEQFATRVKKIELFPHSVTPTGNQSFNRYVNNVVFGHPAFRERKLWAWKDIRAYVYYPSSSIFRNKRS